MKKLRDEQKTAYLNNLIQHPLFATTSQHALPSIINIHYYPKNSLIYLQFDKIRYLYFLLDGSVACHRQLPNSQETFMANFDTYQNTLTPVKIINEIMPKPENILQNELSHTPFNQYALATQNNRHQLTVKATENAFLALLPISEFHKILKDMKANQLFTWYNGEMSQQLSNQFFLYDLLSLKTAQAKIAYYLLAYASTSNLVVLSVSRKNLASILGMRAETLSRTLRTLSDKGIIKAHNLGFVIHKPALLLDMLEY